MINYLLSFVDPTSKCFRAFGFNDLRKSLPPMKTPLSSGSGHWTESTLRLRTKPPSMNSPEFPTSAILVDGNGIQDCDLRKSIQASVMVKKPPNIRLPRRKVLRFHMLEVLIQQSGRFFVILPAPSVQYQQSVARPEARGLFVIPQNAGKDLLELYTGKGRQKPIRLKGVWLHFPHRKLQEFSHLQCEGGGGHLCHRCPTDRC